MLNLKSYINGNLEKTLQQALELEDLFHVDGSLFLIE